MLRHRDSRKFPISDVSGGFLRKKGDVRVPLTLFSLGGGGGGAHCAHAERKVSCVNDVSMMNDVSIATVYSGGVFTISVFFSVFFSFSPFVCKKEVILYFFVLVLIKYVS